MESVHRCPLPSAQSRMRKRPRTEARAEAEGTATGCGEVTEGAPTAETVDRATEAASSGRATVASAEANQKRKRKAGKDEKEKKNDSGVAEDQKEDSQMVARGRKRVLIQGRAIAVGAAKGHMKLGPHGSRAAMAKPGDSKTKGSAGYVDEDAKGIRSKLDCDRLSVAPMMAWTNRHFRYMFRLMTRCTKLYTEMMVDDTILHQKQNLRKFLGFNPVENPVVVQLGGSNPEALAEAAQFCEQWGYDEINLNCGCPSKKVSKRCFGARLMLKPDLVRQITYSIQRRVQIPVTVKCRLGADDKDSYEELKTFIDIVSGSGVKHFLIHARKCILEGLSTAQNRSVPPLKYDWVHKLVQDYPHLDFSLNGHIQTLDQAEEHLSWHLSHNEQKGLKGIMIGRAAFNTPWVFADADRKMFGMPNPLYSRYELVTKYLDYCAEVLEDQPKPRLTAIQLMKPITHLFNGFKGSKQYKNAITHGIHRRKNYNLFDVVREALQALPDEALFATLANKRGS